jgi:signal transduction histidine kinase
MYVKVLLLLLVHLPSFVATARQHKADSLQRLIEAGGDSHPELANWYNQLSYAVVRNNTRLAVVHAQQALFYAEQSDNTFQLTRAHMNTGSAYYRAGKLDSAIYWYDAAEQLAEKHGEVEMMGNIVGNKSIILEEAGRYREALEGYRTSLRTMQQLGKEFGVMICYTNMGSVFDQLEQIDSALYYYNRSLRLSEKMEDTVGIAQSLHSIGKIYNKTDRSEQALGYYRKALAAGAAVNDNYGQVLTLDAMCNAYQNLDSTEKCLPLLHKALLLAQATENQRNISDTERNLGETYYRLETYDSALLYYNKSLASAKLFDNALREADAHLGRADVFIKLNLTDSAFNAISTAEEIYLKEENANDLLMLHKRWAAYYELQSEYAKSLQHFKQYKAISDSLYSEKKALSIVEMQERFAVQEKENKLILLQKEQEAMQSSIDVKNRSLTGTALFTFVAGAFALFFFRARNIKNKQNRLLTEKNFLIEQSIEEIKARDEEILLQNKQLEDKIIKINKLNEEKSYLIGVVAHDLKSPLNQITGLVGLLELEEDNLPSSAVELHKMIGAVSKRASKMVRSLLDAQQIEKKALNLEIERTPVPSFVAQVAEEFKIVAATKQIELDITTCATAYADIDRGLFRQVLENLLSNAVKFSNPNSQVKVFCQVESNTISVAVADNGPGIAEAERSKLFKEFTKLSNKPTAGEASTGLGLSIVKKLAEAMGGTVRHENNPDKGSTFWVELAEKPAP